MRIRPAARSTNPDIASVAVAGIPELYLCRSLRIQPHKECVRRVRIEHQVIRERRIARGIVRRVRPDLQNIVEEQRRVARIEIQGEDHFGRSGDPARRSLERLIDVHYRAELHAHRRIRSNDLKHARKSAPRRGRPERFNPRDIGVRRGTARKEQRRHLRVRIRQ